jgi:hypothetical protein
MRRGPASGARRARWKALNVANIFHSTLRARDNAFVPFKRGLRPTSAQLVHAWTNEKQSRPPVRLYGRGHRKLFTTGQRPDIPASPSICAAHPPRSTSSRLCALFPAKCCPSDMRATSPDGPSRTIKKEARAMGASPRGRKRGSTAAQKRGSTAAQQRGSTASMTLPGDRGCGFPPSKATAS